MIPPILGRVRRMWQLDEDTRHRLMTSTTWIDGLRGIATLGVVSSHLVLCFHRELVLPCCGADGHTPLLFQRPILRLISMGHSWVAVFFVLLGLVNSLKPLKQARAGKSEGALVDLASSSFRRVFRLMLPATLATLVPWVFCQFGLMENARKGDAWWLYTNTPPPSPNWIQAFRDLWTAVSNTWKFEGDNLYNQPQWTMIYLLQGSMMVFAVLLIVVQLTARWRTVALLVFSLWSISLSARLGDPLVGLACFIGIILAELSLTSIPERLTQYRAAPILSGWTIKLSLVLMSMPHDSPDSAAWSDFLSRLAYSWLPRDLLIEPNRTIGSIGAIGVIMSVIFSPHARNILSSKPLAWLGKVSFPVFLLHPLFMQTIMPLLAFSNRWEYFMEDTGQQLTNQVARYLQRGNAMLALAVLVTITCTVITAQYWTMKIEPLFGRITEYCEDVMTGRKEVDPWSLPKVVVNGHAEKLGSWNDGLRRFMRKDGHIS